MKYFFVFEFMISVHFISFYSMQCCYGSNKLFCSTICKESNEVGIDSEYEMLEEIQMKVERLKDSLVSSTDRSDKISYVRELVSLSEKYRKIGLTLWDQTNDSRKYEWLRTTISHIEYLYWTDAEQGSTDYVGKGRYASYYIPLDLEGIRNWQNRFPRMLNEYREYVLRNPQLYTKVTSNILLYNPYELIDHLVLSMNVAYRKNGKIDLDKLSDLIERQGDVLDQKDEDFEELNRKTLVLLDDMFISNFEQYGISADELLSFLAALRSSPSYSIVKWAAQRQKIYELKVIPLTLRHESIDGEMIDIEKWRGKIVLIDFWSVWCSGCIARMPYIKALYDKYKGKGFEVLSICLNNNEKTEEVRRIEKKIGSSWPTLLVGGSSQKGGLGHEIWNRFGFAGVPQLMLLDKEGKLLLHNGVLRKGDFEPLLIKCLEVQAEE